MAAILSILGAVFGILGKNMPLVTNVYQMDAKLAHDSLETK